MSANNHSKNMSPLENASFFSRITYSWLSPLFQQGARRPIEEGDIYDLPRVYGSKILYDKLQKAW